MGMKIGCDKNVRRHPDMACQPNIATGMRCHDQLQACPGSCAGMHSCPACTRLCTEGRHLILAMLICCGALTRLQGLMSTLQLSRHLLVLVDELLLHLPLHIPQLVLLPARAPVHTQSLISPQQYTASDQGAQQQMCPEHCSVLQTLCTLHARVPPDDAHMPAHDSAAVQTWCMPLCSLHAAHAPQP